MNGWITCNILSFSTVFQLYQDDRRVIMKGFVQWNLSMADKISHLQLNSNLGSLAQHASTLSNELSGIHLLLRHM